MMEKNPISFGRYIGYFIIVAIIVADVFYLFEKPKEEDPKVEIEHPITPRELFLKPVNDPTVTNGVSSSSEVADSLSGNTSNQNGDNCCILDSMSRSNNGE